LIFSTPNLLFLIIKKERVYLKMGVTKERALLIAEKACQAIIDRYTPEELPPANCWHYHQSVFLSGMWRVWEVTGKEEYFNYIKGYIDHLVDEEGNFYFARDELDSIQVGILLFPLYEATREEKYLVAAKKLRSLLD